MTKPNKEIKTMNKALRKALTNTYINTHKPKIIISEIFNNIAEFIIICLAIIFQPLNLLIAGIITIIILLI